MNDFSAQEFIQDFLEEAAEHLNSAGRNLLELERSLSGGDAPVESVVARIGLVNELFRSFHTLKGLSGMVGLAPAEQLSHAMEALLRAIQHMEIEITPQVIDRLLHSTQVLEMIVAALRDPDVGAPSIDADLAALASLLPGRQNQQQAGRASAAPAQAEDGAAPSGAAGVEVIPAGAGPEIDPLAGYPEISTHLEPVDRQRLLAALAAGRWLSLAIFSPTPDKATRGENVNAAREQLSAAGELIKAVPLIQDASIRFAFLVAAAQPLDPAAFLAMEWQELESQPAPAVPLPEEVPPAQFVVDAVEEGRSGAGPVTSGLGTVVRVDLERLDEIMRLVSDLVVTRYQLVELLPHLEGAPADRRDDMAQVASRMERHLRRLRQAVVRARLVPLSEVFSHMPLAVRDLARASGKELRLVMVGQETELDKVLVERLLDPLLHLARNAIAHGIEPPETRLAAGKSRQGTLTLRGLPAGDQIQVSVSDDGSGVDFKQVAAQAVDLGFLDPARIRPGAAPLTREEALSLLCQPGFSTRNEADLGAGRGVGMDVVLKMVTAFGGSLDMDTQLGIGTTFTLRLPVTLTIVDALIVRCGAERYAVPRSSVDRVIEIDPAEIVHTSGGQLYPFGQGSLSLLHLSDAFHLPQTKPAHFWYGLVSSEGERQTVLVVHQLLGMREVVVRAMRDPLVAQPGISGATEMGDGSVILILDLPAIFQFLKNNSSRG